MSFTWQSGGMSTPEKPINSSIAFSWNQPTKPKMIVPAETKKVGIMDVIKGIPNAAKEAYTAGKEAFLQPFKSTMQASQEYSDTFDTATPVQKLAGVTKILTSGAGIIFSPISAVFGAAQKLPVLKPAADLMSIPFEVTGEIGKFGADRFVDALGVVVDKKTQDELRPAFQEAGTLVGQLWLGGKVMEGLGKGEKLTREKITELKTEAKTVKELPKTHEIAKAEITNEVKPATPSVDPLATEARKYKTAEEFVKAIKSTPEKIPSSPEYNKFLSEKDAFVKRENEIYAEMKAMRDTYNKTTIDKVPASEIAKYENLQKELNKTLSAKTLAKSPEGVIKTHIGEKGLDSQLTDFYNKVTKPDLSISQAKASGMSFDEWVKGQTKFGEIKKIDITKPQEHPFVSRFAGDFETKKSSASSLTYSTLDKIGSLNTALKQKGFKGVSPNDFKGVYSLDKVIDNSKLFDKYPQLKEVNVYFVDFHTPTQRGVHINNDIFLNSKLYAKDATNIESTLVHEIEHSIQDLEKKLPNFSQFEQGRGMNTKEYAKDLREEGARKKQQEYLDVIKTRSQLKAEWNGAGSPTETLAKMKIAEVKPTTGEVSGVAKNIEAKAIEQGLIKKGFNELAEYDASTLKKQGEVGSQYTIEQLKEISRSGKLPEGMKPATPLSILEDFAKKNKDIELMRELAQSPLVSKLSESASELSLSRMREKGSTVEKIREVYEARKKAQVENVRGEVAKIKESIKKSKPTKDAWMDFVENIRC